MHTRENKEEREASFERVSERERESSRQEISTQHSSKKLKNEWLVMRERGGEPFVPKKKYHVKSCYNKAHTLSAF